MGCTSNKEKIENEMIEMKLERVRVQMERRNNIKLLEDIDGRKIKEPSIPDYLYSKSKVKSNEKVKMNKKICISDNRKRCKSVDIKKKFKGQKTNSTGIGSKKSQKS